MSRSKQEEQQACTLSSQTSSPRLPPIPHVFTQPSSPKSVFLFIRNADTDIQAAAAHNTAAAQGGALLPPQYVLTRKQALLHHVLIDEPGAERPPLIRLVNCTTNQGRGVGAWREGDESREKRRHTPQCVCAGATHSDFP